MMLFVPTVQANEPCSLLNAYKNQMTQLVNQLETAIQAGGDDLEQNLQDVVSSAKIALSLAQSQLVTYIETTKEALDLLAESENKVQVAKSLKDIAQGSIYWVDSIQAMFNANIMIIMAAQQLINEFNAKKAMIHALHVTNN